jgi:hypothetical protein
MIINKNPKSTQRRKWRNRQDLHTVYSTGFQAVIVECIAVMISVSVTFDAAAAPEPT